MARRGQRGNRRAKKRDLDNEGILPVLAKAVREVESRAQRGPVQPEGRTKFQVIALLVREERERLKVDDTVSDQERAEQLKRLDGVATILAKTAARDTTLLELLAEDAAVSTAARNLKRQMLREGGHEPAPEPEPEPQTNGIPGLPSERHVLPAQVIARQLANPFQTPDFSAIPQRYEGPRRLTQWELLEPLLRSFEHAGTAACMELPEDPKNQARGAPKLMDHQARMIASAAAGHRTYLLADEPGLGKTAQALLAAEAADAYPLLAVVPNVVKTNWAREAQLWVPDRSATVIHGDGHNLDAFADIVVVNYEILDRHVGWLGDFGFRGMVVDEAHFIKNKTSQRSRHVLWLADQIRARVGRPLMMALTGTPLINDIEDFKAIWEFLGWITEKKPGPHLMEALEASELTPEEPAFYPAARAAVVAQGIVRRRKIDVASDIPARRIADLPVELDDADVKSIRAAEAELARRLVARYHSAIATRKTPGEIDSPDGIDHELVRRVAAWEREDSDGESSGQNVFAMVRQIGRAKAGLAADYAAQLANSVGKVVFFAKHIDVMDIAEETFAKRGLKYSSIRGDQTRAARERNIDAFVKDPSVAVIVCSLSAAGVGINLQVASNMVLAELSWTDAEQTQAIDRIHRIGQAEPVTAWRIIAAQTIDTRIAELIDSKAGLAAKALDGTDEAVGSSADIQLEAMVTLLTDALHREA